MKPRSDSHDEFPRITSDPKVCAGVPVVRGTRIPAYVILGFLSTGMSVKRLLKEYPTLTAEDVLACIAYAARRLERTRSVRSPAKKPLVRHRRHSQRF